MAADATGRWLAVGTAKGTVLVFDAEDKPEFLLSASERLHEGAVSAILFEPDELRFLSAGADQKLLLTHARGKLEPEDKGRGNNHTDVIKAMIWGPGDRLYTGAFDAAIKSWPRVARSSRRRPRTGSAASSPWRWSRSTSGPGLLGRAKTRRSGFFRSTRRARSASWHTGFVTLTPGPSTSCRRTIPPVARKP